MKHLVFILVLFFVVFNVLHSQTIVYQEGFEGATPSVTTSGTQPWSVNTTLYNTGTKSYSAHIINPGDSSVLTTTSFSTVGNTYVLLEFSHICKIEFFDAGEIYVSANNGASWTKLKEAHYLGTGSFSSTTGNRFTSTAYTSWLPGNSSVPTNGWWQTEIFDISAIASNTSQVMVRFILRDINNTTQFENWGWVVDDIKVTAAISELIPPVITQLPPLYGDTVYSAGPFVINATITDVSGIDTAYIVYTVNAGTPDTVGMVNTTGNTYTGSIPTQSFNSTICYKVVAVDGSVSHNTGYSPSAGCQSFFNKQAMMGIYTIGGTGADYASVTAAVTALNTFGVSGPVEFQIAPGTYTGQINLTAVTGMDAVNTVTFRSANNDSTSVIIQYTATGTADSWVVRLDGASHFIFRHLTLKAPSITNGRVVVPINGATYNLFEGNRIISAGTSTNTTACVYDNNTLNHYNTYRNNYMQGGYYGLYIYGVDSTTWQKGTVIQGNEIVGTFSYPMYIYYTDSTQITGNYIHAGAGSFNYGIACYYINNQYRIVGNRVAITATSSSACYGIRDHYGNHTSYNPSPTGYGLIANNMVSISGGTGTHNGLYAYCCNGSEYYHNSISVTGGSTSARCLYQYNTASNTSGQKFVNNIFSNTAGGYTAYFGAPAQIISSDYNNYNGTASKLAFWNGNAGTLAALQAASGKEVHSLNLQPPFASTHDLTLTNTLLSGKGTYLALVPYDINGTSRPPVPTIGAHEIPLMPKDVSVLNFVTPTPQTVVAEADTVPVMVTITNYGADTITSVDVFYSVNGGIPMMGSFSGQLLQLQTASVVLPAFISPAGNVSVAAWTELQGDTNLFNDTSYISYYGIPLHNARMKRIIPLASPCGLGLETVTAVIENVGSATITGNYSISYRLDNNSTIITHTVTDTIALNDSLLYSFPTPVDLTASVDTTFKLYAWVKLTGDNVQVNDTADIEIESLTLPPPPAVTSPVNIVYGGSATLNASSLDTIFWFDSDTASVAIGSGPVYQTPALFDTTTYYAASAFASEEPAVNNNIVTLFTGNTGQAGNMFDITAVNTLTVDSFDINCSVSGLIEVWYRPGSYVGFISTNAGWTKVGDYTVTTSGINNPTRLPLGGVTVPAGQTYGFYITYVSGIGIWYNDGTGTNEVYTNSDMTIEARHGGGYFNVTLTPRVWNGRVYYSVGGGWAIGCPSNKVPIQVNVSSPPPVDAGIEEIDNPKFSAISGVPQEVRVKLKNYGTNTLTSANITWSLNSVVQSTYQWTGSLALGATQLVVLDTAIFQGGTYCIDSWTSLPNGVADTVHTNDTATSCFNACLAGVYTIGPPTTGNWHYNSFNQAITALQTAGVCGHVIFDVQPETYTEQLTIPEITGMNANNTVTFRSSTGDSTQVILQYSATGTADNWTVRLNGADWFRFEKMTIWANNPSYGRVVELTGGATYNRFENIRIISAGSSTPTTACIYDYNTLNHYNTYINNYMEGGYYTIYIYGVSSTSWQKGTVIQGNVIVGSYYYPILTYYTDSTQVIGNNIHSGVAPYSYGIVCYYTNNAYRIIGNRVSIMATSSSACYGLRDYYGNHYSYNPYPSGYGLVANNMVSITGGTGSHYGFDAYSCNGSEYYHNTISITGGSTAGRCLNQYNTAANTLGQTYKNNIFSNSGGGYAAYFATPASVTATDYNNFYSTATNLAYWGANVGTLAALQAASGKESHSHNINPPFISSHDLHLLSGVLSEKGTPIAAITVDIDGEPRASVPTIGADEVPFIPKDAGVTAILSPGTNTNEGQVYPVQVIVTNFGTDTIYPNSMTIEYNINAGATYTTTYTGVAIPSLGTDTLTLQSMTSPAGSSVICAKTVLPGDSNTFNDPFCKNFIGNPINDAMVSSIVGLEDACNIGLDTISIWVRNLGVNAINSPTPSTVSVSYRIKPTLPAVTQTFTPVVLSGDSVLFHFSTLADFTVTSVDDTFMVHAWVDLQGDNVKNNDTADTKVISLGIPPLPVVSDTTIPYATSVTLYAQSQDPVFWFAQDTATVEMATGASYTTPLLYTTTTYWVQAGSSSLVDSSLFVGTQSSDYQAALTRGYHFTAPVDMTITELMVPATVTQGPQYIQVVKFSGFPSTNASANQHTTLAYIANAPFGVPQAVNIPIQAGDEIGIIGATNSSGTTMSNSYGPAQVPSTINGIPVTLTRLVYQSPLVSGQAPTSTISLESNASIARVEMKYQTGSAGCASTRVPVNVTVSNPQPCDVGVSAILYPVSALNLTSQETVMVRVKNYGTSSQNNIPVSYKIDNFAVVTETIASTIPSNDSVTYTFNAKANLSIAGNTYQIKAWTGLSCDNTPQNDTAWKSVTNLLPNYCISTATSALHEEITNVSIGTVFSHTSPAVGAMYTNHSTTVLPPIFSPGLTYPMSITSSFTPGASTQYACWVKAWVDFNRDGIFDPLTEEIFSQATTSSNTVTANIQIPFNALNGNTMMRVVLNQTSTASSVTPCNTYIYGETEDYMVTIAPQAVCDAGVIQIISPASLSQAATPQPVWVKFMNFGSDPIAPGTLSIAYTLNSGTPVVVAYPPGLPSGGVDSIQMPDVTLPMGNNTLCAYTILACDTTQFNNEICKGTYGQFYTTLPFFDDFESSNMWYKPATTQNWQYGTPLANIINSAYSGSKAWVTNLTGDYSNNADEYLYTPVFNFMGLGGNDTISISFWHWCAMASGDYGRVQYSTNGGQSWINLGSVGDAFGTNWYNVFTGGQNYFSHTNSGWMYAAYKLDPNYFNAKPEVQFRFQFYSNTSATSNGWAIDNFRLLLPVVPNDVGVTAILVPLNDTAAGIPVNVKILITNFGTNSQSLIPVELRMNSSLVSAESWTGMILSNDTVQYTFTVPVIIPSTPYSLCVRTVLPNDAFSINDQTCRNFNSIPANIDVGIAHILSPLPDNTGRICFYEAASHPWYAFPVTVSLKNYGVNNQTSIPISYTFFNGGQVNNQTWTGTLAYGDSVVVLLNILFKPNLGAQKLCVETELTGDSVFANDKACMTYTGVTCIGIEDSDGEMFTLKQNIPNPAKGVTLIGYSVPQGGIVNFGLVNMVGQVMQTESYTVEAGSHQIELDVTTLAAGVYYYFVEYEGRRLTRKMVVGR